MFHFIPGVPYKNGTLVGADTQTCASPHPKLWLYAEGRAWAEVTACLCLTHLNLTLKKAAGCNNYMTMSR